MRAALFILVFLIVAADLSGQSPGCDCSSADNYSEMLQQGLIGVEYSNPVKGYGGQQYFNDWMLGEVELMNGDVIRNIILRYDQYSDQLLWLRKSDYRMGIVNKDDVAGFRMLDDKKKETAVFAKKKIILPWIDSADAYLQVLVSGDLMLYAYRNVNVVTVEYKLTKNTKYIISTEGKDYLVALRRSSLLDLPVIQKSEMKKVLRTQKLAIRDNEWGLLHAIMYYNQRSR
jgi:hypothetical protein